MTIRRPILALGLAVILGFFVAPRVSSDPGAPPEAASPLLTQLESLFDEGYSIGRGKLQTVEKRFEAARGLAPEDPRVDYAWGLVLLKRSDRKGAARQFAAAIEAADYPWWPAWEARVGLLLAEREKQAEGLSRLAEFAKALGQSVGAAPVSDAQFDAARWIGQALEALDRTLPAKSPVKPGARPHVRDQLDELEETVEKLLGDELLSAVEVGREMTRVRGAELEQDIAEKNRAQTDRQSRRKKDDAKKIAGDLADLAQEKVNAARAKDEMNKKLNDVLARADKELDRLEKAFQMVEEERLRLDQRLMQLMQQLTLMETAAGRPAYGQNALGNPAQTYTQLRVEYGNSRVRYLAAVSQRDQIIQQAESITRERNLAMTQHQQETGNVDKRSSDLNKWTDRLNAKVKELDPLAPEADDAAKDQPRGKAKRAAPKTPAPERKPVITFRSYVPLDFEAEKARVLESYREPGDSSRAIAPQAQAAPAGGDQ
ncbi:MAG: hypothetical protein ACT4QC_12720 [Planctomycetaceae bacterium]